MTLSLTKSFSFLYSLNLSIWPSFSTIIFLPHITISLSLWLHFFFLIPFCGFWWHLFIGSFCPHLMFTPNPPPLFSHMKISYKKKKKKSIFQVFPFSSSTNPTVWPLPVSMIWRSKLLSFSNRKSRLPD